jgi:hypothetical protein
MIIEENGKVYNLDPEKGIVTEAATKEVGLEEPKMTENLEPLGVGTQVESEGKLGEIVSRTNSMYGDAYGVRFEDGSFDELERDNLKVSTSQPVTFNSPLEEVKSRYAAYQELPAFTSEELEVKDKEARFLNLRAKSLISVKGTPFSDQRTLDEIIVTTGTDRLDIKEAQQNLHYEQEKTYLDRSSRFTLSNEVDLSGPAIGRTGDASWLDEALADYEDHSDAELAERATEVVSGFSHEQLSNEEFVRTAASYQAEYLGLSGLQLQKFTGYLELARLDQLKRPEKKVAKVEEDTTDLDTFDTSALYMSGE